MLSFLLKSMLNIRLYNYIKKCLFYLRYLLTSRGVPMVVARGGVES